ncbi:uncharacterized protein JCM15063_003152 [Sporobolomyces koalae]|uniref:uncharacterized protein n=1 Tax=Sporobolomyces koalae TaxID=500713 RepID=UPI00316FCB46
MRSSISAVSLSALLLSASAVDALPSARRPSLDVDIPDFAAQSSPVSPTSPSDSPSSPIGGRTIHLQHRRGSEELTNEDGTLNFGHAHANVARARSKYVRGLANFEFNTGSAHFLSPAFVDPTLLPPTVATDEIAPSNLARMGRRGSVWGSGDETQLEWPVQQLREESVSHLDRKDVFDAANLHGVPPTPQSLEAPIANRRALEKRAVPKNPKVIVNPKHRGTATSSRILAVTSTPKSSGAVALTAFPQNSVWAGSLSIGSSSQTFNINFDTGSADLWVPSTSCTSAACSPHSKYDPSKSSTSQSVPGKKLSITYGDGSATQGAVYTDSVTVGGMTINTQTFGVANSLTSDFANDPYDGLMGMAFSSISTLGASTVFETLTNQANLAANQFSFHLASAGSELYLGGLDPSKYTAGSTKYYPVTNAGYWLLDAKVNVGGQQVAKVGKVSAIIDTGTSVIVAPTADAAAFWAQVPNSGSYGGGYYTYDCASPPSVSFSFGSSFAEQWAVSGSSWNLGKVSSGSTRCVGAVVGADIGINGWILGDAFLENVYATFDLQAKAVGFSDLA